MGEAFKAIRRAELVEGGNVIKQGEIFTLGFQLFDNNGDIIVPATGQTIGVTIANNSGTVFETTATVVGNQIEFTVNENIGFGKMRVELKISEGTTFIQKYPADGWIILNVTESLEYVGTGNVRAVTAQQMRDEITAIEIIAGDAKTTALAAEEMSLDTQGQLDAVVNRETDTDAMSRQAAVNSKGVDKVNLKARLDEDFNSVSSQLAEKLNKGQVAVTDINKNLGKFDQTYMSDAFLQQIAGTTPVNAVPADGGVTTVKLADGGTTFEKLSNDVKGKTLEGVNILSKNIAIQKTSLLLNNGSIIFNLANGVSDFVRLIPNQYYSLPSAFVDAGCFYDENKVYISGITFVSGTTFKVPANAKYVRLTINLTDSASIIHVSKYMVVFGKTYPSQYVEYGGQGYNVLVGENQIVDQSITGKHIKEVKNLFDKTKLTTGYIDNTGAIVASATLSYSDYIPVDPNNVYTLPLLASVAGGFYDVNKVWLSAITAITFVVPSNATFIRVNVNIADPTNAIHKDKYMVIKDSVYPSKYVSYNVPFSSWLLGAYMPPKASKWSGKTIYSFGDSITWYDGNAYGGSHAETGIIAKGYVSYMRDELGATVNNYGISGGSIQNQIAGSIKGKTYTGVDAVTITGGVNDWATTTSPPPIGAIAPIGSSFNLATSYGALQSSIEHILTSNPKIKIYLITPIRGMLKSTSAHPLAGQEFPEAYQTLIKSVGELYGIPVCDWYDMVGFNKVNYASWFKDTGSLDDRHIHVGDEGYKRMAEILVPFMRDN